MRFYLVFLALLGFNAKAYDFSKIADEHILSLYDELAKNTVILEQNAIDFCTNGLQIDNLRQSYKSAFLAWQAVQHIRFGPVQYLLRENRFAMWPDKRGTVSRHLTKLLAQNDKLKDIDLAAKSVAVQGFSALEQLLYKKPLKPKECELIKLIGSNLNTMAQGIKHDWLGGKEPYLNRFINPEAKNAFFASGREVANQLLNSINTQLEFIISLKLNRVLGKSIATAYGKRAEAWRSGLALPAISHNLDSLHKLYTLAFKPEINNSRLDKNIEHAFIKVNHALSNIKLPLAGAISDVTEREKVKIVQDKLITLKKLIAKDMAAKLELSLGFNSLDGD